MRKYLYKFIMMIVMLGNAIFLITKPELITVSLIRLYGLFYIFLSITYVIDMIDLYKNKIK